MSALPSLPVSPEPFVALDDARAGAERLILFSGFLGVITARTAAEVPLALEAVEQSQKAGEALGGYLSYELGYALEPRLAPLMPPSRALPLLWFGRFRETRTVVGSAVRRWLRGAVRGRAYAGALAPGLDAARYGALFARAKEYILAGDIYQANLTFNARFAFVGDPLALYGRLRRHAAAGYGGIVADGARTILSFSPELFFSARNGMLTARPMKGTAPRGTDPGDDSRRRAHLVASKKDRAENLMIVDLIRNDLSRVSRTGTVRVEDLFGVETYPTVYQMVSTVQGVLRPDVGLAALVRALFPCGSVTGAPKIRAMEIIRELEAEARGVYCGAVGGFFPDGSARFNVAIRTLTLANGSGTLGIGSGIVADSEASAEYDECLVKARYFTEGREPIGLIETMRYDPGAGIAREELHLARLARSAAALAMPLDLDGAWRALREAVAGRDAPQRVRLVLTEDRALTLRCAELLPAKTAWTYVVSDKRVCSADALARYKTDWRALYESEYTALHARHGCDEVLFLNERGEVAEGRISNVFARFGDRLVTPPLDCGVLDGCLRRALLADGSAHLSEGILTLDDLSRADAVYFGNSLRGLIPAVPLAVLAA